MGGFLIQVTRLPDVQPSAMLVSVIVEAELRAIHVDLYSSGGYPVLLWFDHPAKNAIKLSYASLFDAKIPMQYNRIYMVLLVLLY